MHEVLVVAGEKSAEEHFLSIYSDIENVDQFKFFGVGGEEMINLGVECLFNLNSFSSMGFSEPIKKLPFYFNAMKSLVREAKRRDVKYALLIDFQEFNLKLAERLTKAGIKVLYYVAPQAWAWRASRCKKLANFTHRLFTILPFEKKWFSERGVDNIVNCQHPVFKKISEKVDISKNHEEKNKSEPTILFLPGSRNSEVEKLLPVYLKVIKKIKSDLPKYRVSLVLSDSINLDINDNVNEYFDIVYTNHELDDALSEASLCVSASGTVNLNCAFYKIPTIVCYDASLINFFIVRDLINYQGYASLVNIISEKEIFPELLQGKCNVHNLHHVMMNLIKSRELQKKIKIELDNLTRFFAEGESRPGRVIEEVVVNEK